MIKELYEIGKITSKGGRSRVLYENSKNQYQRSASMENDVEPQEIDKLKKEVLFKIADSLFSMNITLMDVLHNKIYDKVIDGKEYQLIKRTCLINQLNRIGVPLNLREQMMFKDLIWPIIQDYIDMSVVKGVLEKLGITENMPTNTKYLNYSKLQPSAIRIFNKIIRYMDTHDMNDIVEFLRKENLEVVDVVSKNKEDKIQIIQSIKLRDVLRSKDIIKYGEDLDDNFKEFLGVSHDHEDIIMIRKFKRAMKDIKNSKYLQYFGWEKRFGEPEDHGGELGSNQFLNKKQTRYYSMLDVTTSFKDSIILNKKAILEPHVEKKITRAYENWKYNKLASDREFEVSVKDSNNKVIPLC